MDKIKTILPSSQYIEGLKVVELKNIATVGGSVLHMLRCDSPIFTGFGEIYFSTVDKGAVKGWKRHKRQTQNFAVPSGRLKLIFYDAREDSPSYGILGELNLGLPHNYWLVQVPPLLWYAFGSVGENTAVLANCADIAHDPEESESLPLDSLKIPYRW